MPICHFSSWCFLSQLFERVRKWFRNVGNVDLWRLLAGIESNLTLDLSFISPDVFIPFLSSPLLSCCWTYLRVDIQSSTVSLLSAEFDKLLNVQRENQLCLSHWILVMNWGSSRPAKTCLHSTQSMLLWHIVRTYGTTGVWLTTAITQGMGSSGVTCEPSRIVHLL